MSFIANVWTVLNLQTPAPLPSPSASHIIIWNNQLTITSCKLYTLSNTFCIKYGSREFWYLLDLDLWIIVIVKCTLILLFIRLTQIYIYYTTCVFAKNVAYKHLLYEYIIIKYNLYIYCTCRPIYTCIYNYICRK